MTPLIPAGSIVLSTKIAADEIKVGKVILFNDQNNKRVTAHRVMEISEGWYVTKGDANTYQDRYLVNSADVIGAVLAVFPLVDPVIVIVQLTYLALTLVLGILLKRFLLFLKHGNPYPTTAHNTIRRFCVSGCSKKVVCGRKAPFSPN